MRALLAAALLAAGPAFAGDPVYGTWTWDPGRSLAMPDHAGVACYVTSLEDLGNGKFRETSTRLDADGTVVRRETVSAFDGADHPDGAGGTGAFTRIDAHRYAVVIKAQGKPVATLMRTISDDGNTMTQAVNGTRDGKPFHDMLVFERKDARCEQPDSGKKP